MKHLFEKLPKDKSFKGDVVIKDTAFDSYNEHLSAQSICINMRNLWNAGDADELNAPYRHDVKKKKKKPSTVLAVLLLWFPVAMLVM